MRRSAAHAVRLSAAPWRAFYEGVFKPVTALAAEVVEAGGAEVLPGEGMSVFE